MELGSVPVCQNRSLSLSLYRFSSFTGYSLNHHAIGECEAWIALLAMCIELLQTQQHTNYVCLCISIPTNVAVALQRYNDNL